MAEVIVPLLELPVIEKTPPGKLLSKADFLCLLYGHVNGNFIGFRGKNHCLLCLISISISQESQMCAAGL